MYLNNFTQKFRDSKILLSDLKWVRDPCLRSPALHYKTHEEDKKYLKLSHFLELSHIFFKKIFIIYNKITNLVESREK